MDNTRRLERPELVTVGVMPVQFFVAQAIPLPPGTPARSRPDRPPFVDDAREQPSASDPASGQAGTPTAPGT
jgi:hypothetical protein